MKILILGSSGYIGKRLHARLKASGWAQPVCASRGRSADAPGAISVVIDVTNREALTQHLKTGRYDCIVNSVAGDFKSITQGASSLAHAAIEAGCERVVHLSTMSVYGRAEGLIDETTPFDSGLGWYSRAKCEAEDHLQMFAKGGGKMVVLRPGCVFGPGSELWVGRIARWLRAGRIGDMGAAGDGWSNLVHVEDLCEAVAGAMSLPLTPGATQVFNLAGPDSPRWNQYFADLAIAIGATPLRTVSSRRLRMDLLAAGAPLKLAEKLLDRIGVRHPWLPEPISPSVVGLFASHLRLDARSASTALALNWTPYAEGLTGCSQWFLGRV